MTKDFLKIPLQPALVTQQKQFIRIPLSESVADLIRLITITHFGEYKQDESFGNELWENDFENIVNIQAFKEKLSQSLQQTIIIHEKRLSDIKVRVGIEQVTTIVNNRRIRQKVVIEVEATLRKTNESFYHQEIFFMGPLSYY
jgi:hypothetical protein